ncbi:MAG TPA: prepilin peptidase [Desulfotomaculum sp.]|uniref:prepilin peptidase n=1 Tax=Desulfofundulus thermobenzoicus TaxID=29376 RepID=UPI00176BF5E4|nr:A24 family peptidase [Desulfofundulus thermobenzoicus]HHW44111.1 prepilin peptidase [Desulfotomaculum sp.]
MLRLLVVVSYVDWRDKKIPNGMTLPAIVAGILLAGPDWRSAALDAAAGFLLFFPIALLGLGGMGDAKLSAAVSSLIGFHDAGLAAWLGTVLCAVMVAAREFRRGRLKNWVRGHFAALAQIRAGIVPEGEKHCFAPYYAACVLAVLFWRWFP